MDRTATLQWGKLKPWVVTRHAVGSTPGFRRKVSKTRRGHSRRAPRRPLTSPESNGVPNVCSKGRSKSTVRRVSDSRSSPQTPSHRSRGEGEACGKGGGVGVDSGAENLCVGVVGAYARDGASQVGSSSKKAIFRARGIVFTGTTSSRKFTAA